MSALAQKRTLSKGPILAISGHRNGGVRQPIPKINDLALTVASLAMIVLSGLTTPEGADWHLKVLIYVLGENRWTFVL